MKILILGGDGFCGWPTALHLSRVGHDVLIVDNFSRRRIDGELGTSSLTPIADLKTRLKAWKQRSGRTIKFQNLDVATSLNALRRLLRETNPGAIVHFAEQRSAPYSMKTAETKQYTVSNNLNATNNLLAAVVDSQVDAHIVHLGTMGVYGYGGGAVITEGYVRVRMATRGSWMEREILYPSDPGSVYHMTKTQDQMLFAFYNKNDGIRVTDLHQGIVWGTQTDETRLDERLVNRFDYDGDYGTVLNRFLMQAVIGYPLTVHGTGGQMRAFINIRDSVRCIELAIANPPSRERVRIMNQVTEVHRVRDLARMVVDHVPGATIQQVENPRKEAAENDLDVQHQMLPELGLRPTRLEHALAEETIEVARRYAERADVSKILCKSYWVEKKAKVEAAA